MSLDQLFTHASIIDPAIGLDMAARVRAGLTFERYALLDRGSYEHTPYVAHGLTEIMCELASGDVGATLQPIGARVVRLRAGDYLLARHDNVQAAIARDGRAASEGKLRRQFELVLDVSPATTAAEIHYRRRGQVFFRVPCVPGSLAIVERTSAISCNHTYVSKLRDAQADVMRLVIQAIG